jgi:hypothetical protein
MPLHLPFVEYEKFNNFLRLIAARKFEQRPNAGILEQSNVG